MGQLYDGAWVDEDVSKSDKHGRFNRTNATFRNQVGQPDGQFPLEAGRYHLIVSAACPWCHRVMISRALRGLTDAIPLTVVAHVMREGGWRFSPEQPAPLPDLTFVHQLYTASDPTFTGRVTLPVLWDTQTNQIVNNESSDLLRMLDLAFEPLATPSTALRPPGTEAETERWNNILYDNFNNGVYRAGFAATQTAYEEALTAVFDTLDTLEKHLNDQGPFLLGDRPTEADWRAYVTLARFDAVYVSHFKCNLRRITDYPAIWRYARQLHAIPNVANTTDFYGIKQHYFRSHPALNPRGIVPAGPQLDWTPE